MKKSIDEKKIKSITDVFEMLRYGSEVKMKIISQNPYITDFIINAYYSDKDEVSCEMKNKIKVIMEEAYQLYFGHIDQTKLNNNVNLSLVYKMLIWIGEGILLEQRRLKRVIHYEDTLEKFDEVMKLMKKSIYKNEYLMEE